MSAPDPLDQLSSEALHDLAVRRALRHFDAGFFWQLLKILPAAEVAAGEPEEAELDLLTLRGHLDDLTDSGRGEIAESLRPFYLDYLRRHGVRSPEEEPLSRRYVHTCLRVRDPEASVRFYGALGFEPRGRLNFPAAYNLYLGLPGDGDVLELTVNRGHEEPYDLGTGYNHMAFAVDDIHAALADLEPLGVQPEKPPYHPGDRDELPLIAFVADPDGYRIELIEGEFATPQDPEG